MSAELMVPEDDESFLCGECSTGNNKKMTTPTLPVIIR
jgi:hypothetical protein